MKNKDQAAKSSNKKAASSQVRKTPDQPRVTLPTESDCSAIFAAVCELQHGLDKYQALTESLINALDNTQGSIPIEEEHARIISGFCALFLETKRSFQEDLDDALAQTRSIIATVKAAGQGTQSPARAITPLSINSRPDPSKLEQISSDVLEAVDLLNFAGPEITALRESSLGLLRSFSQGNWKIDKRHVDKVEDGLICLWTRTEETLEKAMGKIDNAHLQLASLLPSTSAAGQGTQSPARV